MTKVPGWGLPTTPVLTLGTQDCPGTDYYKHVEVPWASGTWAASLASTLKCIVICRNSTSTRRFRTNRTPRSIQRALKRTRKRQQQQYPHYLPSYAITSPEIPPASVISADFFTFQGMGLDLGHPSRKDRVATKHWN